VGSGINPWYVPLAGSNVITALGKPSVTAAIANGPAAAEMSTLAVIRTTIRYGV
jgi:hypothetical protein